MCLNRTSMMNFAHGEELSMTKRKKAGVVQMRARKADITLFDQAARALGTTRSALIRHAAVAHARRILSLPEADSEEPSDG